jgi:hypothetical protein
VGISAPPISYSVNGKQYVAVLVGSKQPFVLMLSSTQRVRFEARGRHSFETAATQPPLSRC